MKSVRKPKTPYNHFLFGRVIYLKPYDEQQSIVRVVKTKEEVIVRDENLQEVDVK